MTSPKPITPKAISAELAAEGWVKCTDGVNRIPSDPWPGGVMPFAPGTCIEPAPSPAEEGRP
jgi:hypothetical protein